jgi:hypothetical protein
VAISTVKVLRADIGAAPVYGAGLPRAAPRARGEPIAPVVGPGAVQAGAPAAPVPDAPAAGAHGVSSGVLALGQAEQDGQSAPEEPAEDGAAGV